MGLSVPANDADHDSILGAMNEKIANKANGHASGPGMRHKVKFVRRGWGAWPLPRLPATPLPHLVFSMTCLVSPVFLNHEPCVAVCTVPNNLTKKNQNKYDDLY